MNIADKPLDQLTDTELSENLDAVEKIPCVPNSANSELRSAMVTILRAECQRRAATVRPAPPQPTHLGDGVYVAFDGYHITLAANDHQNIVVSLEPPVMKNLRAFADRINAAYTTDRY